MKSEFREGKASQAGPTLLAIIGFSFLVSGPLVTDIASTARDQMTLRGIFPDIFGAFVFSLSSVSCFVFWNRFHEDVNWKGFQGWTRAAARVTSAAVILLTAATKTTVIPKAFIPWNGPVQRSLITPYLMWIFAFAYLLRRKNKI